ncbi:MAG: hypothetical protein LBP87_14115 [Planctomycetaceae bacterium]|jgi:hypothetical protein|nr:hypothetical protein [Planctomycetaceae bacterium]
MKKSIFSLMFSLACFVVFCASANADEIRFDSITGSGTHLVTNEKTWGTAYDYNWNMQSKQTAVDLYDYFQYLGGRPMNNTSVDATPEEWNEGLLADEFHLVATKTYQTAIGKVGPGGKVEDRFNDGIYGVRSSELYNAEASGVAAAMGIDSLHSSSILTSFAAPSTGLVTADIAWDSWVYDDQHDTFLQTRDPNGIRGVDNGSYAFVSGFTYDNADASSQLLNGMISMLGTNLDILINGFSLDDRLSSYYYKSNDTNESEWFEGYNLEIDLAGLWTEGILSNGINNIAFILDTLDGNAQLRSHYDDGLLAFSAELSTTGPGNVTPEPATMLIFLTCGGLALVAGRLRKCKKTNK